MGQILAEWSDFSGGNWGNLGPERAKDNQWGGINVMLDRQGNLAPVCAARPLKISGMPSSIIVGMHWAWGSDDRVYLMASNVTATFSLHIYRFHPSATATQTVQVVGNVGVMGQIYNPDFVIVNDTLYVTRYGTSAAGTYAIDTAAGTTTRLTGSYGNAPGGRAICAYGERLVVGGISDARFGVVANRIVFSGDDTGNNPTDRTAWETLNYFDVGPTDRLIAGLYATRDYLTVVMEDQTVWIVTGTLGTDAVARRMSGYNAGSGGLRNFKATAGVVDPSQLRVWMYDGTSFTLNRFNGASLAQMKDFGNSARDRTGSGGAVFQQSDALNNVVTYGGPDEVLVAGVAIGAGSYSGAAPYVALFRSNGAWALTDRMASSIATNIVSAYGGFLVANDRKQTLFVTNRGNTTSSVAPTFSAWFAGDPPWDAALAQGTNTQYPEFYSATSGTTLVSATLELPFRDFQSKTEMMEAQVDGIVVEFIPQPDLPYAPEGLSSQAAIGFSVQGIGKNVAGYARTTSGVMRSGLTVSTNSTYASTISATATDVWPNVMTQWFPLRMNRVTSVRVRFDGLKGCRICRVVVLGKLAPARYA